jgi:hypothetical protein
MKIIGSSFTDILIIGNGFDLNLGLKTSYEDFLESPQFNLLDNHLSNYLSKLQKMKNWIDVEKELKNYSAHEARLHPVSFLFKPNFTLLSNALMEYLKTINYRNIDRRSHAYKLIRKISSIPNFIIIDFNYTNSTRIILEELGFSLKEIDKILIKIHGSIEEEKIIFGVEDGANISSNHLFLRKAYPRHFKGINLDNGLKNIQKIHFFGHSIGETDHTYFFEFFRTHSDVPFSFSPKEVNLYHYGDDGYDELQKQIDALTRQRLSSFKQNVYFNPIDVLELSTKLV